MVVNFHHQRRDRPPDVYKMPSMAREIAELSTATEQPFKQKPRKQTTDKEKHKKLYDKVDKFVLTGQSSLMKYISISD